MTRIQKYPMERLRRKGVAISLDCPNCEGVRLNLDSKDVAGDMEGVRCHKCEALVLLDSLSLTVVQQARGHVIPHS